MSADMLPSHKDIGVTYYTDTPLFSCLLHLYNATADGVFAWYELPWQLDLMPRIKMCSRHVFLFGRVVQSNYPTNIGELLNRYQELLPGFLHPFTPGLIPPHA